MFLLGEKSCHDLSFTPIGAEDGATASVYDGCAQENQGKATRLGAADRVALLKVGWATQVALTLGGRTSGVVTSVDRQYPQEE